MGMTIGEKILARASGKPTVSAGEIVTAKVVEVDMAKGRISLSLKEIAKK